MICGGIIEELKQFKRCIYVSFKLLLEIINKVNVYVSIPGIENVSSE